jgi:hypothetical protein
MPTKLFNKSPSFIAFCLGMLFFIIGLATLSSYGQNWDEPLHFFRGKAFLHYFLTGKKDYSDLPKPAKYFQKDNTILFQPVDVPKNEISRRSIYEDNQANFAFFMKDYGHPPLSDILASVSNYVFFQKLGLINDVDSFHLYCLLTASVLVGVLYWWIARSYGWFAGVIASLSLSLYPLFLGEAHYNIKDVPETVFYSLTLIGFHEAVTKKSYKWMLISSICFGLAIGTKFNAVFLPFILLPWTIVYFGSLKNIAKNITFLLLSAIMMLAIGLGLLYACWPYLWSSPILGIQNVISYYRGMGTNTGFDPRFLIAFKINTFAIQWILYSTPFVILFPSFLGIYYSIRKIFKQKDYKILLILLWFIIPIARVSMPNAGIYGGVRQIMEYIPAMAMLTAFGFLFILDRFKRNKFIISIFLICLFLPITWKIVTMFPNESVYFNPIIGGLKGAKAQNLPEWGQNLGNVNKLGIQWINANAEKNARIATNFGLGSSLPSIFIRSDIQFNNSYRSTLERQGEYIIALTHQSGFEDTYFFQYYNAFLIPVYEVKVDDTPILVIWKNDIEHTREEFKNSSLLATNPVTSIEKDSIKIDLQKEQILSSMIIRFNNNTCQTALKGSQGISDDDVIMSDGVVELSNNNENWFILDGNLRAQTLLSKTTYRPDESFHYYFALNKARYIKIEFDEQNPCFSSVQNIEIYGFQR